jgi:hypothetical protein
VYPEVGVEKKVVEEQPTTQEQFASSANRLRSFWQPHFKANEQTRNVTAVCFQLDQNELAVRIAVLRGRPPLLRIKLAPRCAYGLPFPMVKNASP